MDVLQEEIGKEPPWLMLFADDLVICEHSRAEVELRLEMERDVWVTRTKSKNRVHAMPRKKTKLSTFRIKKWRQWKRSSIWAPFVWCQRRSRERCKQYSKDWLVKMEGNYWGDVRQEHTNKAERKVYTTAVQHAMVYGAEYWAVRKRRRGNCTQLKCACCGGKRGDKTRSGEKCRHLETGTHVPDGRSHQREEVEIFAHVQMGDKDEATSNILQMPVDGKRNRGRPKRRWRDLVKEDMARNQMTTEMAEDRSHDPSRHSTKCRGG